MAGTLLACGRGPPSVSSLQVTAGRHEGALGAAGLDAAQLEDAARRGLTAAGFRMGKGRRTYQARMELVLLRTARSPEDGSALAEVAVDLEVEPDGPGNLAPLMEAGVGTARLGAPGVASAWRAALDAAAADAATGLSVALAEEAKTVHKLTADLSSPNPRVREQAIRVLGDRRSVEAVPALIERLRDPDPHLSERAAGALSQIRDVRAVGPLIDLARRRADPSQLARFARIIGDIGGSEARGYLETLASGHPDPRVRASAQEALEDLEDRERERGPR